MNVPVFLQLSVQGHAVAIRASSPPPKNKNPAEAGLLLELVPEIGIEPTTYALRMRRSTN